MYVALKDVFKSKPGIASARSSSPGHEPEPELKVPDSGPDASVASPVVSTIHSVKGKERPFPEK